MSTQVNKLQTFVSSVLANGEKSVPNTKDNRSTQSEKFVPVPYDKIEDKDLPIWQVRFEVLKTNTDFLLEINGDIILGVENTKGEVINILKYNNQVRGVSRRHLKITPTETDLLMIDLESTNGTRKNGKVIQPNTPYSIYNGDILELGDLILAVNIVKAPNDRLILTEDTKNIVNALTHISTAITSNLNTDDVLDRILEMAINLSEAEEIALLLWDEQARELYLRAERGIGDKKTRLMKIPMKKDYPVKEVLRSGEALRSKLNNGQKSKVVTGYLVEAALYVPITVGEDSIGILIAMHRSKGKEFTVEDERLLTTLGKFAAIAIQNSQKFEATNLKLQRKLDELASYNSISQALSKTNTLSGIYNVLRNQIREHWKVDNIGLWLVDKTTNCLEPFPKPSFHKSYSLGEEIIGSVADRAEPLIATDIKLFSQPKEKTTEPTLQLLARSAACVPIIENENILGVLAVFSTKENEFDEEDLSLLKTFSQAASAAIRNAFLFEQVDKQRATILASVNMLPHPVMIVDQDGKMIVSNKAADSMLAQVHSMNGRDESNKDGVLPLLSLLNGLSESKWDTKEIVLGDKMYVTTIEYASMVGTVILMQDVTDPVTGTFNRRYFNDLAEQTFQQAKRYNKPLAALVVGLKDLERIISEQGYAIGNQVLKELVCELRGLLRVPDILGRYQEDDFIVILPETSLESAKIVAERIIQTMAKTTITVESYKLIPNIAIGIAMLDFEEDDSVSGFMRNAYTAFTVAKNDKKQKIKIYKKTTEEN